MKEIFLQLVLLLVCIWINSYHHSRKCHNFDIKGRYNILYSSYIREYMKCSYRGVIMVSMQGSWESRIIILKLAIFFIQKKPVLAGV